MLVLLRQSRDQRFKPLHQLRVAAATQPVIHLAALEKGRRRLAPLDLPQEPVAAVGPLPQ
jgi:hypothetical protein